MAALLDVNALIALLDAQHVHHLRLVAWYDAHADQGWATCPLTENGFVRIVSHSGYSSAMRFTPKRLVRLLADTCAHPAHEFWPDDRTLRDPGTFRVEQLGGAGRITDAYLLALAVHHRGSLVTLDQRVNLSAVPGAAPRHLQVLQ